MSDFLFWRRMLLRLKSRRFDDFSGIACDGARVDIVEYNDRRGILNGLGLACRVVLFHMFMYA